MWMEPETFCHCCWWSELLWRKCSQQLKLSQSSWFSQEECLSTMANNSSIPQACLEKPPLAIEVIKRKWPTYCPLIVFPYQLHRDNTSSLRNVGLCLCGPDACLLFFSLFKDITICRQVKINHSNLLMPNGTDVHRCGCSAAGVTKRQQEAACVLPFLKISFLNIYTHMSWYSNPKPSLPLLPLRDGYLWFFPLHYAQLHVLHLPGAVPGAVCLHLQKAALPQEDHHHLDNRRGTGKHSAYSCAAKLSHRYTCRLWHKGPWNTTWNLTQKKPA